VIRRATIGAAVPAPRRPAAWVAPIAVPRFSIGVHFETARVAAGNVATLAHAEHETHAKQRSEPGHRPVAMVVSDHARPQTVSVRRAPKRSANQPRLAETGHRSS